jgi:hypothetical protein
LAIRSYEIAIEEGSADVNDKSSMSFRDDFTGFWNVWKPSVIQRDYALLE